jgi:hypothetical protein
MMRRCAGWRSAFSSPEALPCWMSSALASVHAVWKRR